MRLGPALAGGVFLLLLNLMASLLSGAQTSSTEDERPSLEQLRQDPRVVEAIALFETWAEAMVAYQQLPDLSVGIVYDQGLVWSRGIGYADVESRKPATPSTIYSICSISKLFTSIGAMQLRDQGKLELDDPVADYIPWMNIQNTFPDGPPITIRGILSHSSGLPRETGHSYWSGPGFPFPTRQEIIDRITHLQTLYPARSYYQYSNLGLTLAGELITQLSGQPYEEYMRVSVLKPIGLTDTTTQLPEAERGKRLSTGYAALQRDGTRQRLPFFQAKGVSAAAGYASTVQDLATFASWQFRVLSGQENRVLSGRTLREMQRVHWVDEDWNAGSHRGLGFDVWRESDRTLVGHGGGCPGYRTHLSIDPKQRVAAIVMINATGVNPNLFTSRAHQIVGGALKAAVESPGKGRSPDPSLQKYVGIYRSVWGEEAAVIRKGELALLSLPGGDPLGSLSQLKKHGKHTFRRVLADKELGEVIRFELDEQGRVTKKWRHGNYSNRVE